jgi:hypothetical protein
MKYVSVKTVEELTFTYKYAEQTFLDTSLTVVMMFTACLPQHSQNPIRTNRSSGLIRNSYLLNKQIIMDNRCLGLAYLFGYEDQRELLLTFGLGIIILQGVSRRISLAGVNIIKHNG